MNNRQLWLLAGGNGAGKSTFYRTVLQPLGMPFVNADVIAAALYPDAPEVHSYEAARKATEVRRGLLFEGRSFCFETVFSHPSKIDFVAEAKAFGYQVIFVYIHLDSAGLNKARVSQRVSAGGHSVPEDKIESRLDRLAANIRAVIPLCDQLRVLDNSSASTPFAPVLSIRQGLVTLQQQPLPPWAEELLLPA